MGNLDRLYEMMETAKKEHRSDDAAVLRWAIFTIEQAMRT